MKVLVACEESQRVCAAFRERGHEAYSCDIIDQTNLSLMFASVHQSQHNKDKILSDNHRKKISENNRKRKGKRRNYTKPISAKQVYDLKIQGYSFNKISQILNLDWGCVKRRYNDYIHDNPELLESDTKCAKELIKDIENWSDVK